MSIQKLHETFQKLTDEHNIFAPQEPFQCCSSFAWAALDEKKYQGMVFYHEQDAESSSIDGYVLLGFGVTGETVKHNEEQLGALICQYLLENGLEIEWDCHYDTKIKVNNITLENPYEEEDTLCMECGYNDYDSDWDYLCSDCREEIDKENENE